MATYSLPIVNGTTTIQTKNSGDLYHDVAFNVVGTGTGSGIAGTVTIKGRKGGSSVFEDIPDGTVTLATPNSIQFTGGVAEYQIIIADIAEVTSITMTDTSQRA